MGLNREIEYIDNPFPFFQEFTHCDMTKAKEMIGFESEYSIEKGIQDYYNSVKYLNFFVLKYLI